MRACGGGDLKIFIMFYVLAQKIVFMLKYMHNIKFHNSVFYNLKNHIIIIIMSSVKIYNESISPLYA